MTNAEYVSPDGLLRFLVQTSDDGVVCLGFDGYLWHRHAHELTAGGLSEQQAVEQYVRDLLQNRAVIEVSRVGGMITSVRVADDPAFETINLPPGMAVELRYWNGKQWDGTGRDNVQPAAK